MLELKIAKIISFLVREVLREIQKRGGAFAVAAAAFRAPSWPMGVCITCWVFLAQSQHTVLRLVLAFLFVFGFFLFWKSKKKKKPSGEWDIGSVLSKSARKTRARVRTGHASRDTERLSCAVDGCVEGRRKMYLRKDTMRWKSGGWIQVSRRERKVHVRRLYQQLLLASEFRVCMCVISHSVTHHLYGRLLLVYSSARLHRKGFVILLVAINKWHWVLPQIYIGIIETSDSR